jgi:broad specificity phosphatase PhoE
LSSLYLIRHGQAGPRRRYDALSDLGKRQAGLLGEYLAGQKIPFKAFISGCLQRQQQTAQEVWRAYRQAGLAVPEILPQPCWNEFDMTGVFEEFAPMLSEVDLQFRQDYHELLRKLEDESSPVHHVWTECDSQIMRAWIEGRFPSRTESWAAFNQRVLACRGSLSAYEPGDTVAVFTSASPIAIWVAAALGAGNGKVMRLAGVLYNSAITTLRLRAGDLTLFSFNGVPHLTGAELRTFR